MDVEQARAFLVLSEELHFGHAADRLNLAQPPLSRMIKQLERQLKVELFSRSTRKVELTAAGKAIIEPARQLVEASDRVVQIAHNAATGSIGTATLGFAGASIHQVVGHLARLVKEQHRGIDLSLLSSQFSHIALEKVSSGELDAAIGRWDFLPAEISSKIIGQEELLVAVAETHLFARQGRQSVSMSELADQDWISLPGGFGSALRNRFNALAKKGGFVPHVRMTAPDSWTQLVLVGADMGIALVPDSVRKNVTERGVHYMKLNDEQRTLDVRIIWSNTNKNPALAPVLKSAVHLTAGPAGGKQA